MIKIRLNILPPTVTFQDKGVSVRNGKPILYDKPELKEVKAKLRAHLSRYQPKRKLTGPIEMTTIWEFPVVKDAESDWHTKKPDLDNLNKMLQDQLQDLGFFENDSQIASLNARKFYSHHPGITITLEELED